MPIGRAFLLGVYDNPYTHRYIIITNNSNADPNTNMKCPIIALAIDVGKVNDNKILIKIRTKEDIKIMRVQFCNINIPTKIRRTFTKTNASMVRM